MRLRPKGNEINRIFIDATKLSCIAKRKSVNNAIRLEEKTKKEKRIYMWHDTELYEWSKLIVDSPTNCSTIRLYRAVKLNRDREIVWSIANRNPQTECNLFQVLAIYLTRTFVITHTGEYSYSWNVRTKRNIFYIINSIIDIFSILFTRVNM